jgi:hypothetical protein
LNAPSTILPTQPAGLRHRFHAMAGPVGSLGNLDWGIRFTVAFLFPK